MQLSPQGQQVVQDVANRHGFSPDAVTHMLVAVSNGNGTQAQFNHPEFGGMGQWSQGGMIMIGDMFNNALKARVDALCSDLSRELAGRTLWAAPASSQWQSQGSSFGGQSQSQGGGGSSGSDVSLFVGGSGGGSWWPAELGSPSSTGSQNDLRYAYFPAARRLAIDIHGQVTVYDTGDHQIGGVAQQQGSGASFTFTSQLGLVRLADLRVVQGAGASAPAAQPAASPQPQPQSQPESPPQSGPAPVSASPAAAGGGAAAADIFAALERLADLKAKGIVSAAEFEAKKAEMLSRL